MKNTGEQSGRYRYQGDYPVFAADQLVAFLLPEVQNNASGAVSTDFSVSSVPPLTSLAVTISVLHLE